VNAWVIDVTNKEVPVISNYGTDAQRERTTGGVGGGDSCDNLDTIRHVQRSFSWCAGLEECS